MTDQDSSAQYRDLLVALRDLLPQLERDGVVELDVRAGEARLYVKRRPGSAPRFFASAVAGAMGSAAEEDTDLVAITSPLSGVFYASPAPDEPPYVAEGDDVEAGQVVALVEAMKVFNEIHADVPGTIVKIGATAGELVQSGQVLFRVRPSGAAPATAGEAV